MRAGSWLQPAGLPSSDLHLCSPTRFEFDVPLEEVPTRKLDVAVKNNKMFYTKERKDIGMVGDAAVCGC